MSARAMTAPNMGAVGTGTADATVPASMQLPRRLGKYMLTDTLGEGAMGVVYRALDPHIDRVVALKTIRKTMLDTPAGNLDSALRFRNEARAAGRLTHPGIVSIFEYCEEGEQSFIVMEYVEGRSLLRCTLPHQRLPLADVLSVGAQLLRALSHAHARGVWHRDIKPSNLIVTASGQLKVTDFGIARIDATALTQDATIMGSCGYMAPECYSGGELDQRVDLFACGVLLYELLTGRRPFKGIPGAVMHQLLHDEPPALADAACNAAEAAALAPFEAVLACAMAKDRAHRYPGAQEMLDALACAAGQSIAARVSIAAVQRLMPPRAAAAVNDSPPRVLEPVRLPTMVRVLAPKVQPIREPPPLLARAAQPPPEPRPIKTSAPATANFDATSLDRLNTLLLPTFGPVARVVVQRAAAKSQGLAALVACLANELPTANERRQFLAQAQQAFSKALPCEPAARRANDGIALPVLGTTPLCEEAVQRAERALTRHVGPIARLMVKRARAQASSREQFIATLVDLAAECIYPEHLQAELEGSV